MAMDSDRVKALFLAAAELADMGERLAYLDRETSGDPELRARLDELLSAHRASVPTSSGDAPTIGDDSEAADRPSSRPSPPRRARSLPAAM